MRDKMEQINIEEIMQEIRAQIQQRGYVRNELKFEDVEAGAGEVHDQIDDYFELNQFGLTVDHMKHTRKVRCWRMLDGSRLSVFFKKMIRKMSRISSIFTRPRPWRSCMPKCRMSRRSGSWNCSSRWKRWKKSAED